MNTNEKTETPRECFSCKKIFPYHEMTREHKKEWAKFIYLCSACKPAPPPKKASPEGGPSQRFKKKYLQWW
jgi:hypothetical protein